MFGTERITRFANTVEKIDNEIKRYSSLKQFLFLGGISANIGLTIGMFASFKILDEMGIKPPTYTSDVILYPHAVFDLSIIAGCVMREFGRRRGEDDLLQSLYNYSNQTKI